MSHWGYHLMIDAGKCCRHSIRSKQVIYNFNKELVKNIDMVAYGEPQIQHFGSGNKAGYTLVQLIETSNISAHFVEETNDMYLDVFSCKPFTNRIVEYTVNKYFLPMNIRTSFRLRQAPSKTEIPLL